MANANPFPTRAVAVFVTSDAHVAEFGYMLDARDQLSDYLKTYPAQAGAIALEGAHGSGKTFMLTWLALRAKELTHARPCVVYAKADGSWFSELYAAILTQLTRDELASAVGEALRRIAEAQTGVADATHETHDRLKRTGDLQAAIDNSDIDANALKLELQGQLELASSSPDVARRVAAALVLLEDSHLGEAAYDWLRGRGQSLPQESLREPLLGDAPPQGSGMVAVAGLEIIAALFRLAGRPFVLLIDQMENLLSGDKQAPGSSLLKKLIEQTSAQGAFVVLAGTPEGWRRTPRDVIARLRSKMIKLGNLPAKEVQILLQAYLPKHKLGAETAEMFRAISGGNPREILQTGHAVWIATDGNFAGLTARMIEDASREAGALEDRVRVTRETVEELAASVGLVAAPETGPQSVIDYSVRGPGGYLGIVIATPPDRREEAELGLKLTRLRREYGHVGAGETIVVIMVGYASFDVVSALSTEIRVVRFNEASLREELYGLFARIASAAPNQDTGILDGKLDQRLDRLETKLTELAASRARAEQETLARLAEATDRLRQERHREREPEFYQDLRDHLVELERTVYRGDAVLERSIVRNVLVANQSTVRNDTFEYLGELYLEALALRQSIVDRGISNDRLSYDLDRFRKGLVAHMIDSVSSRSTHYRALWRSLALPASLIVAGLGAFATLQTWARSLFPLDTAILVSFAAFGVGAAVVYVLLDMIHRPAIRFLPYVMRLNSMRYYLRRVRFS